MPSILVVADDLTGAMDTAYGFAVAGHLVRVAVRTDRVPNATVVAVNTNSRYADPNAATKAVRDVVSRRDEIIYKKIDSTLRGNVVSEIDAVIDATNAEVALVAPAFPATERITRDRIHRVDGTPVDESEYAADEKGPTTSDLPNLLSASKYPVIHVGIDVVERGAKAVADLIEERPALIACDATTDEHLGTIARSADRIDGRVLFVGSGGLAMHVATVLNLENENEDPVELPELEGESVLGIVGSVNRATLSGLAAVPNEEIIFVDPEGAVANPVRAGQQAGKIGASRLATGEPAVMTAARSRDAVEDALAAGEHLGYDSVEVRTRIAMALATATRTAVESERPTGLFVTGGDVAMDVFESLEATSVSLSASSVEVGIPIGVIDDGVAKGIPIVTKAGGFGTDETVINCLRTLKG